MAKKKRHNATIAFTLFAISTLITPMHSINASVDVSVDKSSSPLDNPTAYWNQLWSMLAFIGSESGLKGKNIGLVHLDSIQANAVVSLLEALSNEIGFSVATYPVQNDEMQSQSLPWLRIRKARPDWVIVWDESRMSWPALIAAERNRYPIDRIIGNWFSPSDKELSTLGNAVQGYRRVNFTDELDVGTALSCSEYAKALDIVIEQRRGDVWVGASVPRTPLNDSVNTFLNAWLTEQVQDNEQDVGLACY